MKQQTPAATETGLKGKEIIDFSGKKIYVGRYSSEGLASGSYL